MKFTKKNSFSCSCAEYNLISQYSTVDLSYAHRGSLLSIEEETMRQYMVDNNPLDSCNYRITFYRKRGSFIKQNKLSSNEINKRDLPFSE